LRALRREKQHLAGGVDAEVFRMLDEPARNGLRTHDRRRDEVVLDDLVRLLKHPEPPG
jgi:hypothetical protein